MSASAISFKFSALFLAGGLGAGARGFVEARAAVGTHTASFTNLGGVDIDALGLDDFKVLAKGPPIRGDLHTMQPADIRAVCGDDAPDAVFSSTPCKGFSRLLGKKAAAREAYQALNRLTLEAMHLVVSAYPKRPPKLIILENVPGIRTRGAELLGQIRALLSEYGYVFHESTHDCGEIGGLGAHRRRFLLVARHERQLPAFLYRPPKQRVKACGEVLGPLPLPNVVEAGPLHVMPGISWVNWVRLALIPPGGDWRDLPRAITTQPDNENAHRNKHAVSDWNEPAGTVTGATRPGSGAPSVADARVRAQLELGHAPHNGGHGVQAWNKPAKVVRGAMNVRTAPGSIADERVSMSATWHKAVDERLYKDRPGLFGVNDWTKPAPTVSGKASVSGSNMPAAIADVRVAAPPQAGSHQNKMQVLLFDQPAPTVTGAPDFGAGALNIADKRLVSPLKDGQPRREVMRRSKVQEWSAPLSTVTGPGGNGVEHVADPRIPLGCSPRSGAYGVQDATQPGDTITGSACIDNGRVALADARAQPPLPPGYVVMTIDEALAHASTPKAKPPKGLVPVIYSPTDGTWHRPLTTLELAVLQGLPPVLDGKPLELAGRSQSAWRERIGNAVPVGAARAIAEQMLRTLIVGAVGLFVLGSTGVWVAPYGRTVLPARFYRRALALNRNRRPTGAPAAEDLAS